jgi:hypothetical protein
VSESPAIPFASHLEPGTVRVTEGNQAFSSLARENNERKILGKAPEELFALSFSLDVPRQIHRDFGEGGRAGAFHVAVERQQHAPPVCSQASDLGAEYQLFVLKDATKRRKDRDDGLCRAGHEEER